MSAQPGHSAISLARGAPSLDLIDLVGLRVAAVRALADDPAAATGYGDAAGHAPLREWLAASHGVGPDRVIVANGSMEAGAFVLDLLVEPGAVVVVEEPSYDRTLAALAGRRAEVVPIALEADGLDVEELAQRLRKGLRPALVHVIPTHHNPAGCTLSAAKRDALAALASRYGFTVLEDDPYRALAFDGHLPRTVHDREPDRVVYASSFSKVVCPGVRVGYVVAPAALAERLRARALAEYISPGMLAQATVWKLIEHGGLERSLARLRRTLAQRAAVLGAALERELPAARFQRPTGGYFLWLVLPDRWSGDELARRARRQGVEVVAGSGFVGSVDSPHLRLAFSAAGADELEEGVHRLGVAARELFPV